MRSQRRVDVPYMDDAARPGTVLAQLDVYRLGRWVRFEGAIVERDEVGPVVASLSATDDDGVVVPVGKSEHASIVMLFLQSYYRWRRHAAV